MNVSTNNLGLGLGGAVGEDMLVFDVLLYDG